MTTINAYDLSCQGLTQVDRGGDCPGVDSPTFNGQPVVGYFDEMARRGEAHVYSCDRVGHMGPATCGGCGDSMLKAYPPEQAGMPGDEYICHHCIQNGVTPQSLGFAVPEIEVNLKELGHDGRCDNDSGTCTKQPDFALISAAGPDFWNGAAPASLAFVCADHLAAEPIAHREHAEHNATLAFAPWNAIWDALLAAHPEPLKLAP